MDFKLSPDQDRAVDAIRAWLATGEQSFVLGGYAGTGKTSIIHKVIEGENAVVCATPTGKAAAVLQSKLDGTGIEVGTLHSLLYKPINVTEEMVILAEEEVKLLKAAGMDTTLAQKRVERLIKKLEQGACEFGMREDPDYKPLVIVDEASMVGDKIEADLRNIAAKILFVGDPGQLPPVEGTEFFERNTPDVVLEKIHRQDADSSILQLAHAIRHGEKFDGWDANCVNAEPGDLGTVPSADQNL